ncbi:hypothetical protein BgiBS90_033350 [Biomphalaria glabrata]|nr:hypothetical protein BgiBS90_033350 [Biomphalaria glabrata]
MISRAKTSRRQNGSRQNVPSPKRLGQNGVAKTAAPKRHVPISTILVVTRLQNETAEEECPARHCHVNIVYFAWTAASLPNFLQTTINPIIHNQYLFPEYIKRDFVLRSKLMLFIQDFLNSITESYQVIDPGL